MRSHVTTHKVAVIDIRMPPTHTNDGLLAAIDVRAEHPEVGILVLSQYVQPHYVMRLLEGGGDGVGYLLKDRVTRHSYATPWPA